MRYVRSLFGQVAFLAACSCGATGAAAACNSHVTDEQSVTGFSTLADGQPASPGHPNLVGYASYYGGETTIKTALQITPSAERFCNSQFLVIFPNLFISSRLDSTNSFGLGWQQRWVTDDGHRPTVSTLVTTTFDWSKGLQASTTRMVLVVAKTVRGAVLYANGIATHQFGGGIASNWTEAAILGVKIPARPRNAWVTDLVVTRGAPAQVEVTYQLNTKGSFELGPGVAITLRKKPIATLGIAAQFGF